MACAIKEKEIKEKVAVKNSTTTRKNLSPYFTNPRTISDFCLKKFRLR
jgi:hypothetical protein